MSLTRFLCVYRIMYPAVGAVMLYYVVTASLAMVNMSSDADQCMGEWGGRRTDGYSPHI